ncbi:hypothetical protein EPO05_04545, partial [Patescibacteria group bacterium]
MYTIVTVTDGNQVNQIALRVLIKGLRRYVASEVDIVVLSPPNVLTQSTATWLDAQGIAYRAYPLIQNGDIYQVKFLLVNFLRENQENTNILYLDPDHIVLGNVFDSLKQTDQMLNVSSEVSTIDSAVFQALHEINSESIHYNTSLVYGYYLDWLAILDNWASIYNKIETFIPNRYREEIAFGMAAKPSGIDLLPVSNMDQSGFHNPRTDCILFHYGGEFPESKRIKLSLKKEHSVLTKLFELLHNPINEIEAWVVNKIVDAYKE